MARNGSKQNRNDPNPSGTQAKRPTVGPGSPKPGSDPEAARAIGGAGDFGVAEDNVIERQYASRNTKASDPGAAQPRSGESEDGARVSGAGANDVGPGSGSGGDVDPDFIGVGTGGSGIAASGNLHARPGPDDATGTSRDFASGPPAEGRNQTGVHEVGGSKQVEGGTTVSWADTPGDDGAVAEGADAATNPRARDDDSFAGEISGGEARGEDQPISPEDIDGG